MATKKQKRLAAKAKHDAFMEEMRRSGLEAQRKDHEERARRKKLKDQEALDEVLASTSMENRGRLAVVFSGTKS